MGCRKSKQLKDEEADEPVQEVAKLASDAGVKVHIGPLELGSDGVVVKPKFNLGIMGNGIYAMAGVRDVRDGLAAETLAMAMKSYSSKGSSLVEVLNNIKAADPIPLLDDLVTAVPELLAAAMEETGANFGAENLAEVDAVVHAYVGVGMSAGLYLGWIDTAGYSMYGVEGRVATVVAQGLSLRVGWHEKEPCVRVVGWLSNLGFDAVLKLKERTEKVKEGP